MTQLVKEYDNYGKVFKGDAIEFLKLLHMEGISSNIQIHDPPYAISKTGENITFATRKDMIMDFGEWDHVPIDIPEFAKACDNVCLPDGSVLVFFNNWMLYSYMANAFFNLGYKVDCLIWKKTNPRPQIRKRNFVMCHEAILWAHKGKHVLNFSEHKDMYSVIETSVCSGKERIKDIMGDTLHTAQKPLKILEYLVQKLSNPGDVVIDAYAGVLSSSEAAVKNGRGFIANELNQEKDYLFYGLPRIENAIRNVENVRSLDK